MTGHDSTLLTRDRNDSDMAGHDSTLPVVVSGDNKGWATRGEQTCPQSVQYCIVLWTN